MKDVDEIKAKLDEIRDRDHSFKTDGKQEGLEWVLEEIDEL